MNSRLAALLIGCAASSAAAQPTTASQVFPAEYFAAAHPADAYDMVRKLPGFELIEGDEDVRGFSGSRGNVLFDGRPPSGKEQTLEQALRRIPAANVVRVELLRGGATSSATGNYDLVANIVRRTAAATNYSATGGASAASEIGVKPDLRFELTRQSGDRRLEAAFAMATDIDDDSGRGSLVESDGDGLPISREDRDEREFQRILSATAEYETGLGPGQFTSNLSLSRERSSERIRAAGEDSSSLASEADRLWEFEAGAQYGMALAGGEFEALATQRLGRLRSEASEEDEEFVESRRTSESIGRLEYRRGSDRLRLFGSLEAALNRLASKTALTQGGVEVAIAGSDVDVGERRVEGALGAIWKPRTSIVIEPTIRLERSTIRSTGDSPQRNAFLFWKPRLRGSWEAGASRLQVTIEREAAQLDFGDFVASAELGRDDVVAGAVSLVPSTSWLASATFEQRFWDDGALLLTLRQEWIDDVIDRVVVEADGELFDAVGNIGKGSRRVARAELTLPLARAGLPGVQLRAGLTFLHSRVTDPVTGQRRSISGDRPFEGEARLTHDLPGGRWSWGAEMSFAHREQDFRFDEVRLERKGASFSAHIEYRPAGSWRLRAEAVNLNGRDLVETRRKFDGPRSTGTTDSIETKAIRTSPIFTLSVRKAFGASAG